MPFVSMEIKRERNGFESAVIVVLRPAWSAEPTTQYGWKPKNGNAKKLTNRENPVL